MLDSFRGNRKSCEIDVLDFGCGTGELVSLPLAHLGYLILGIDSHTPSIILANHLVAKRRSEGKPLQAKYSMASLEELSKDSKRFDVIIASEVLEHLYEPEKTIESFRRLLKPNGICIITVPNGFGPFENLRRLEKVLMKIGIDQLFSSFSNVLIRFVRTLKGGETSSTGFSSSHSGYLNFDSGHVQFYRLKPFLTMFSENGFSCQRAEGRSFLCGPYVDLWAQFLPGKEVVYALNGSPAKKLPLNFVSDWMFAFRLDRSHN